MLQNRRTITAQKTAVNGCCDPVCTNPFDLSIIAVADELPVAGAVPLTYQLRTQGFPGSIVGIRVLNQAGEVDITSLAGFGQSAQAIAIGSGIVTGGLTPVQKVDAATWHTDECLCAVALGCVTSTVGPSVTLQLSTAYPGQAQGVKLHAYGGALGAAATHLALRLNFYVCYNTDAINDPSAMCNVGFRA